MLTFPGRFNRNVIGILRQRGQTLNLSRKPNYTSNYTYKALNLCFSTVLQFVLPQIARYYIPLAKNIVGLIREEIRTFKYTCTSMYIHFLTKDINLYHDDGIKKRLPYCSRLESTRYPNFVTVILR